MIYKNFCHETFDENGVLNSFELNYPNNFNFGYDVVDKIADESPDKRALVWCNTENEEHIFSFKDIRDDSNKIANVLLKAGIKKGDKVMLILKRHYEYWFAAIALHKIGAVMIPSTHMLTVSDFVYRIKASKISAVICTVQNHVPEKILSSLKEAGQEAKLWTVGKDIPGFSNLSTDMAMESAKLERIKTDVSEALMLYFTSGTTGNPKGVIHDHSYPLAHIVTAKYWQQAQDNGLHFTIAETGWAKVSWGKIYGQWLVGSAVMVYDFDNFDPKQLTNVINRFSVTSFCASPTVYRYLVRKGIPDMPSLLHASTAGEALAPEIFDLFKQKTGLTLYEGYGQTETCLLTAYLKGSTPLPGSLGKPSPLYNIELRGQNNEKVGLREVGEIVVAPKNGKRPVGVFCSYLDNEKQYEYVWRNGVYHTGDSAYFDEEGRFWFHGRFDDLIKTGGFRVGPYEVENILSKHPAILECSVVGVPDPLRGQAIKAVIVLNSDYLPSSQLEKEIKDFANSSLAEYKWIRLIEFAENLPKTISGKIRKIELRKKNR